MCVAVCVVEEPAMKHMLVLFVHVCMMVCHFVYSYPVLGAQRNVRNRQEARLVRQQRTQVLRTANRNDVRRTRYGNALQGAVCFCNERDTCKITKL